MPKTRNIALIVVLAATALTPAAALASNGADDNPGAPDNHRAVATMPAGNATDDNPGTHERSGATAPAGNAADDNPQAHDRRGGAGNGRHGGRIASTGTCTAASTATLKVKRDNRRLQTEFEVDQNRSGVTWTVEIDSGGNPVVKTNATTAAPSGSFSLERRIANGIGSDSITATATSPSGEVCSAAVTV